MPKIIIHSYLVCLVDHTSQNPQLSELALPSAEYGDFRLHVGPQIQEDKVSKCKQRTFPFFITSKVNRKRNRKRSIPGSEKLLADFKEQCSQLRILLRMVIKRNKTKAKG